MPHDAPLLKDKEGIQPAGTGLQGAKEHRSTDPSAGKTWQDPETSLNTPTSQPTDSSPMAEAGQLRSEISPDRPVDAGEQAAGLGKRGADCADLLMRQEPAGEAISEVKIDLDRALAAMEAAVARCARLSLYPHNSTARELQEVPSEEAAAEAQCEAGAQVGRRAVALFPCQQEKARIQARIARAAAASREKAGAKIASEAEAGRAETRLDSDEEAAKLEEDALRQRKAEAAARLAVREAEERIKREAKARRKREPAQQKARATRLSALGATELNAVADDFLSSMPSGTHEVTGGQQIAALLKVAAALRGWVIAWRSRRGRRDDTQSSSDGISTYAPKGPTRTLQAVLDNDRCTEQPRAEIPRRSGGRQKRMAAQNRRRADVRWLRGAVAQVNGQAESTLGVDWFERSERNITSSRLRLGYSFS